MSYNQSKSNTTSVTCGAGIAYPFGAHGFIHGL